ncbi:hypothetical protein FOFC_03089 [Fusarium oxysporum]|nr:hypothetical protein FOFC_03089 [Fusarium oxysporum]
MVPNSTSLTPSPVPTSSPTPTLSPAPVRYHEPPDEFVQDRITYVKRATITKKGFRLGSSHIWKYGLQYIRGSDKKEVYYCHECTAGKNKQELFVINGTSKVRNHLEQKHQIDPQSGIKKHSSTRKSVLDQQKSAAATNTFFWKDSMEKFKELLIRWIVYCHIAFFQLENRYFRELLFFLNPALLNHLPKAAKTIRSWVMDAFLSKKQRLREDLQRSRSRISISFDLWTSPNPYAILGVIAMWIDTTGKRRTTVLGIRRVYGEHTGENLGSVVLELLKEYDIGGDEIGYFMLDNASSNDTAVGFILKELCPWMDSKQRRHRRLRCLGHIVNLCCQAFLMGRNCEKYLAKLEKHYQRGDYVKHWFELEKIELALKDFYAATLLSEGKKTSLADWFSTLDCLLREISETKDHYHDIHTEDDNNFTWKYLQSCADAAWSKCAEYYNNQQLNWQNRFPEDTDLPPAYYAAQILDPYRKWAWFRQEWVLHGDEEKRSDISLTTTMDVSVSSLAQSSATSSSSSVLPSDSASQFASTLSEPEASSTEHTVKRRKLRAIATWDHFRGAQGDEPRAISGNLLHYCKRCRNPSWSTHISSNARYHLKKAHHIFVREDSSSQNKRQLAIENAFARTTARQLQQVREHERNTLRSVINVDAFREAQMLLSAHRHLPLNFVTWPEYQALLTAVNPAVQEFLTDSGNTVAADLDRAYDAHQQSVKKWLEHARSLVHIAMDVWSSPQRKAYVAVHAQWVDEAYKPRKALLGLPNLRRSHAGAAMTPHLMEIIRKYHLAPRIGYFTGDNDAKNDTCLRQLAVGLSQEYGLTFDPVSSRTRCAGHIINLSLQAFLFATSEDALQAAIEQAQDEANDVTVSDALHDRIQSNTCQKSHGRRNKRNDTAGWRSIGPMDNIAVFIRNSTVRNDAWDDIAGKALGIDNITRWNSWFKLLDAAISQEGPLSIFLNQYHEELEDDILTHDDWQVLKMTHEFLQPFYQATLEQQMEWASIDQVLENMDILFLQFENAK